MKRSAIFTVVATLVGFCTVTALREIDTQKELGRRPLGDTGLTVVITQTRSIGAPIGLGDAKTWISIVDQNGIWRQTQQIVVIGPQSKEWATWHASDRIELRTEHNFQVVDVPLGYESGSTLAHEVVLGIANAL
ncbi:MAG: hypothetical protein ABIT37_13265 [Luteolibacter sp.]